MSLKNLKDFIKKTQIKIEKLEKIDNIPYYPRYTEYMNNYRVVLKNNDRKIEVYFSIGENLSNIKPTIYEIIHQLIADANVIEKSRNFKEWIIEMNIEYYYKKKPKVVKRLYKRSKKLRNKLKYLLGYSLYKEILWNVAKI